MAYAIQQDLIDRFTLNELLVVADPTNSGTLDEAQITTALNDADADIDLYIGTRYELPLPSPLPDRTTTLLTRFACDLAFYYLGKDSLGDSESKQKAFDDVTAKLKAIAAGSVKLAINTLDTDDDDAPDALGDAVDISSSPRLFSRDTMGRVL